MASMRKKSALNKAGGLNIAQTATVMALLTLGTKPLGFVRELVTANAYGTSYIMDAFGMAQTIPALLLSGVLGVLGTAYMPIFSELTEQKSADDGKRFTNQVITFALLAASITAVFGIIFSDCLVQLFAPRFEPWTAELTSCYLKIVFLYSVIASVISIVEAYLRYNNYFLQPILASYLNSAGLIAVTLISTYTSHYYLAFGLLLGAALQLSADAATARRAGYRYRFNLKLGEAFRRVFPLALPAFIGSSFSTINGEIDKLFASALSEGSIASLNYGARISGVIGLLTGSIIGTIFYPKITKAANYGDWRGYSDASCKSITVEMLLLIPLSLGAIVFSNEVVQVIYERGAFDTASTTATADALRFYSIGLLFSALAGLLGSVFNSFQEIKIPVICGAVAIASNVALDLALVELMQHRGLALASSASSIVNFAALTWAVKKKHRDLALFPQGWKTFRICLAAVLAVLTAVLAYHTAELVWMPRMAYLCIAVAVSIAVYLLLLKLLKIEELAILKELFRKS